MTSSAENTTVGVDRPGYASAEQRLNVKLQDTTGSRLLTRAEFCSVLSISQPCAERWAQKGVGPRPVKIGPRRIGYRVADVLAFISACRQAA